MPPVSHILTLNNKFRLESDACMTVAKAVLFQFQ